MSLNKPVHNLHHIKCWIRGRSSDSAHSALFFCRRLKKKKKKRQGRELKGCSEPLYGLWNYCKGSPFSLDQFCFLLFLIFTYLFVWLPWVLVVAHEMGSAISTVLCGIFSCRMQTFSCGRWDLVPWPGIELRPPVLGAWSLSHWTTREVLWDQFCRALEIGYSGRETSAHQRVHLFLWISRASYSCVTNSG